MYQIEPGMSTSPSHGFGPFWGPAAVLFDPLSHFPRNNGDLDSSPKAAYLPEATRQIASK
jgi:hypothetical protein